MPDNPTPEVGDPDVMAVDTEEAAARLFARPEGEALEDRRRRAGLSARKAAAEAGMSDTWWRNITRGWSKVADGVYVPVRANAVTLARMALVVGMTQSDLVLCHRRDAADLLDESARPVGADVDPEFLAELADARPDEIEKVKAYLRGIKDSRS